MTADILTEKLRFFRKILEIKPTSVAASALYHEFPKTNIIVDLSAPDTEGKLDYLDKVGGPENRSRVMACLALAKMVTAWRSVKNINGLTKEDILNLSPVVVLSGERYQIPAMAATAFKAEWPEQKLEFVECGFRGVANTRTQFDTLNDWLMSKPGRINSEIPITFISSGYHLRRVALTAEKILVQPQTFVITNADFQTNKFKIRGELRRIRNYFNKGDVADQLTRGRIYCIDWNN